MNNNLVKISQGQYADQEEAVFKCGSQTSGKEVGQSIINHIKENDDGIIHVTPTQADNGRTNLDEALEPLGCERVRPDDTVHLSRPDRRRTKTYWHSDKNEIVEEEIRDPQLLINGQTYSGGNK